MLIDVLFVIACGALVGVIVEIVLTRRHRARQVRFAPPDLGPEAPFTRGRTGSVASGTSADRPRGADEGFRVIGPMTWGEDDPPRDESGSTGPGW